MFNGQLQKKNILAKTLDNSKSVMRCFCIHILIVGFSPPTWPENNTTSVLILTKCIPRSGMWKCTSSRVTY